MNIIQRIVKNTVALFVAELVAAILSMILAIAIARELGDVIFGKYSFAIYFVALFTQFADLGYTTLSLREVARDKSQASKYLSNNLSIRVILSLLIFAFIVVTINIMNYPTETKNIVYLFGICTLTISLAGAFNVIFRAYEKFEYESAIMIIVYIARASLCLLALFLGYGLFEISLIFAFSGILTLILFFLVCERKFIKTKLELDFAFLKNTIKLALPFTIVTTFGFIYVRIDTIMLSIMKGDAVVGWYNAAATLTYGLRPIPHFFMSALLPVMSYYYMSSKDSLKIAYEKSFKYLLILGLPIAVGTTLLSDKIIFLLYGSQFSNSVIALQILGWDILLIFLYSCLAFLLISIDRQVQMAVIAGCTALINIILNLFLIPSFSYIGAAIATIAAEGFLFLAYVYVSSRYFHKLHIQKIIVKPIIACAVMGFFVYTFHHFNLIVLIITGCFLYFAVLYVLKGFSEEDISLLKKVITRKI